MKKIISLLVAITLTLSLMSFVNVTAATTSFVLFNDNEAGSPNNWSNNNNLSSYSIVAEPDGVNHYRKMVSNTVTSSGATIRYNQTVVLPKAAFLTDGSIPYKMVAKARIRMDATTNAGYELHAGLSNGTSVGLRLFGTRAESTSDLSQRAILLDGIKADGSTNTTLRSTVRQASSGNAIPAGEFIDCIAVLNVPAGTAGTDKVPIDFYIEGSKYTMKGAARFELDRSELNTALAADTRFMFAIKTSSSTAFNATYSVDDSGIYVVDTPDAFDIVKFNNNAAVDATTTSIPVSFTNEIYRDAFADAAVPADSIITLTKNGEAPVAIPMSDIIFGNDQKSITISNLSFEAGASYSMSFAGLQDIFANTYSGTAKDFSLSAIVPFRMLDFNEGVLNNIDKNAVLTAAFSNSVAATDFTDKVTLTPSGGTAGAVPASAISVSQTDDTKININLADLALNDYTRYTIAFSTDLADGVGTKLESSASYPVSFKLVTSLGEQEFILLEDYDALTPDNPDDPGYITTNPLVRPTRSDMVLDGKSSVIAGDGGNVLDIVGPPLQTADSMAKFTTLMPLNDFVNRAFEFETRVKFVGSTDGQLRLRFQDTDASSSITYLFFRDGKVTLRGSSVSNSANKISAIDYDADVWYNIKATFKINSSSPKMFVRIWTDDLSVDYGSGLVDIPLNKMFTVGSPASWNDAAAPGIFALAGADTRPHIQQSYMKASQISVVPAAYVSAGIAQDEVIATDAAIGVHFSDIVNPAGFAPALYETDTQAAVPYTTSLSADGKTILIKPTAELGHKKNYTLELGTEAAPLSVKDIAERSVAVPYGKVDFSTVPLPVEAAMAYSKDGPALHLTGTVTNNTQDPLVGKVYFVTYSVENGISTVVSVAAAPLNVLPGDTEPIALEVSDVAGGYVKTLILTDDLMPAVSDTNQVNTNDILQVI